MAQLQTTAITGSLSITGSVLTLPSFTDAQTGSLTASPGQWWFNSTTNRLSFVVSSTPATTAWSTGGNMISGRFNLGGAGTQNEGLAFGGFGNAPNATKTCTEEYNGTSWTAGGALATARYAPGGAGTQNAGLAFGGSAPNASTLTEEYNGTSWAAGGAMITAREKLGGAGTQNEG
jgi:hypothetical protein